MERIRKPCQGVFNIIRFNWHFYILAVAIAGLLLTAVHFVPDGFRTALLLIVVLIATSISLSLLVSFYVYDGSGFYKLGWLNGLNIPPGAQLVNIHAGFDETSMLLAKKYPSASLRVLDFYDPRKHTEVSIKRARKAYPPFPGTKVIRTSDTFSKPHAADCIFLIFAAHEIRDTPERITFFLQLQTSLKQGGKMVVVEHLRDGPNFMAYNIGFLHFFSKKEWNYTFKSAGLTIVNEAKQTPFVSIFILQPHGTAS